MGCTLCISQNMWLPIFHKWRRINHSSDPSCRFTSSTTWHLLPLSLNHLNDKQSCPFSFHQRWNSLRTLWSGPNCGPHLFWSIFWPKLWSFFISTLFYLIWLSTINNTVWKDMSSWSINCNFIREGLEPSFVLRSQLLALNLLNAFQSQLKWLS